MLNEIETIVANENYEFINAEIDEKIDGQKISWYQLGNLN